MDPSIFDKRVVRRNIRKGIITQQQYVDYIKGLDDKVDDCEPVEEQLYLKDEPEEKRNDEEINDAPMPDFS
jgi:hypothetical protein